MMSRSSTGKQSAKIGLRRSNDAGGARSGKSKVPSMEEFVRNRDFSGALALLDFERRGSGGVSDSPADDALMLLWTGYCAFHLGKYDRAMEVYTELKGGAGGPPEAGLYLACVYYYMQMYKEAEEAALAAKVRVMRLSCWMGCWIAPTITLSLFNFLQNIINVSNTPFLPPCYKCTPLPIEGRRSRVQGSSQPRAFPRVAQAQQRDASDAVPPEPH